MTKVIALTAVAAAIFVVASSIFGCKKAAEEPKGEQVVTEEQLICPVSGEPARKDISYEYGGKTYYFCCTHCLSQFKENPEKFIKEEPE